MRFILASLGIVLLTACELMRDTKEQTPDAAQATPDAGQAAQPDQIQFVGPFSVTVRPGATLSQPLRFSVTYNQTGVSGVSVDFTTTSGTVAPTFATSDGMGMVATTPTVGTTLGDVQIQATVRRNTNLSANTSIAVAGAPVGQPAPDMTASGLSLNTSLVSVGQSVPCQFIVRNQGSAAVGTFDWRLYESSNTNITLADRLVQSGTIASLAAGAQTTVSCTFTASNPRPTFTIQYVGVLVDPLNNVPEEDETNNTSNIFTIQYQ